VSDVTTDTYSAVGKSSAILSGGTDTVPIPASMWDGLRRIRWASTSVAR
jgi:hypothetical protein